MRLSGAIDKIELWLPLLYAVSLPLSMTASWVLYIAGVCVCVLQAVLKKQNPSVLRRAPLTVPILLFTLVVLISGTVNGGIGEGFQSVASLKPHFVYFWAYWVFIRKPEWIFPCIAGVLTTGAAGGIWGTIQQLTGWHPFGYQYLQGTGFLGGPMPFAGQMQLFSMLALGMLALRGYERLPKPWNNTVLFALITLANCSGAFFASERSAWLGMIAGVIAIAAMVSWKALIVAIGGMAGIGAFSWFFIPVVQKRLLPLLNWQDDISVRVRFFLWKQAVDHWKQSPLLGVGFRRFPHFDIPEAIVPGKSIDINHAHSNIFQIATTLGAIGLIAYLFLIFKLIWVAAKQTAARTLYSPVALGVFGGCVALFISGLFEYNFGTSQVRLAEWFIAAMVLNLQPLRAVEENVLSENLVAENPPKLV